MFAKIIGSGLDLFRRGMYRVGGGGGEALPALVNCRSRTVQGACGSLALLIDFVGGLSSQVRDLLFDLRRSLGDLSGQATFVCCFSSLCIHVSLPLLCAESGPMCIWDTGIRTLATTSPIVGNRLLMPTIRRMLQFTYRFT